MSKQDEQHHPDESADASVLTEASLPDVLKNLGIYIFNCTKPLEIPDWYNYIIGSGGG